MKLEDIIKLKQNNFEIKLPKDQYIEPNPCWEGYEAIGTKIDENGKEVPNCVPIKEEMKNIVKEGFPIPSPSSNEDEQKYISRCISEISGEYETDQAYAICKTKWDEKPS
jgi:hypothetical protein